MQICMRQGLETADGITQSTEHQTGVHMHVGGWNLEDGQKDKLFLHCADQWQAILPRISPLCLCSHLAQVVLNASRRFTSIAHAHLSLKKRKPQEGVQSLPDRYGSL